MKPWNRHREITTYCQELTQRNQSQPTTSIYTRMSLRNTSITIHMPKRIIYIFALVWMNSHWYRWMTRIDRTHWWQGKAHTEQGHGEEGEGHHTNTYSSQLHGIDQCVQQEDTKQTEGWITPGAWIEQGELITTSTHILLPKTTA
jgi:hypothetical protein